MYGHHALHATMRRVAFKCEGDDLPEPRPTKPADASASAVYSVYFQPNYPENVGHFLIDDVFAAFYLVWSFGLPVDKLELVIRQDCSEIYKELISKVGAWISSSFRATPLLRVIVKFTVKNAVCMGLRLPAYGEFDCEFDYDSQEWSCSERGKMLCTGGLPTIRQITLFGDVNSRISCTGQVEAL